MELYRSFDTITIMVEEYIVHIYYNPGSSERLDEAKHKGISLGGKYSAQLHGAHTTPGQEHIHIYARENKIFALNKDGTAHNNSHGVRIPNKVASGIEKEFPDFTIPPNKFIESANQVVQVLFRFQLLEDSKKITLASKVLDIISELEDNK